MPEDDCFELLFLRRASCHTSMPVITPSEASMPSLTPREPPVGGTTDPAGKDAPPGGK
jgi:hypothetical protein